MRWTETKSGRKLIRLRHEHPEKRWTLRSDPETGDIFLSGEAAEKLWKYEQMEALGIVTDLPPVMAFECDPEKNRDCRKTGCYINGGECRLTTKKEYAKETET